MRYREAFLNSISWIIRQKYHIVFISSLFTFTVLVTWWTIFLYASVNEIYNTKMESVKNGLISYTLFHGHNKLNEPETGIFKRDKRLEIVTSSEKSNSFAQQLLPFWKGFWIQPEKNYIFRIKDKLRRKRIQILGECGLLLFLIIVSGLMIYRMYFLERRTTLELHELWSRVTHEIKTPITGLKAFLQTLQKGDLNPDEIKPLVEMAIKQVERQNQLSENMLIGQKLKRRASGIKIIPVNIREFLSSYLELEILQIQKNNIQLIDETEENEDVYAYADVEALSTIFDNIIDNAGKYGGTDVLIKVVLRISNKDIYIIIKDNGPGFDPKMAGAIFNAYKRIGSELPGKTKKGTGMGLYISQRLAKKMGGNLTANSEGIGKGAEFVLILSKKKRI